MATLDQDQVALFLSIAWHIWKSRCTNIFESKLPEPENTLRSAQVHLRSVQVATFSPIIRKTGRARENHTSHQQTDGFTCWTEGSFKDPDKGGAAYFIEKQGQFNRYEIIHRSDAASAFQMEAIALLNPVQAVCSLGISECHFQSDSELLVQTFKTGNLLHHMEAADWRAYLQIVQIGTLLLEHPQFSCVHIPIEDNQRANQLANLARVKQMSYVGYTYPLFNLQEQLPSLTSNMIDACSRNSNVIIWFLIIWFCTHTL